MISEKTTTPPTISFDSGAIHRIAKRHDGFSHRSQVALFSGNDESKLSNDINALLATIDEGDLQNVEVEEKDGHWSVLVTYSVWVKTLMSPNEILLNYYGILPEDMA